MLIIQNTFHNSNCIKEYVRNETPKLKNNSPSSDGGQMSVYIYILL